MQYFTSVERLATRTTRSKPDLEVLTTFCPGDDGMEDAGELTPDSMSARIV